MGTFTFLEPKDFTSDHIFAKWLVDNDVDWGNICKEHPTTNIYYNKTGRILAKQVCDNTACTYRVYVREDLK